MTISDAAQRNHDELFPGHVSTLKVTDPELIEVFDNFAFDEVLRYGDLDTRTRLMVQLAAIIACQALDEYRAMLGAALTVGRHPGRGERDRLPGRSVRRTGQGLRLPARHQRGARRAWRRAAAAGQSASTPETRAEVGLAVQKQIVGDEKVDGMYAAAADDEEHIQRYLSANCFGDYVARSGIDLQTRELLTFSMLVALGGADAQVKGHVAGNLNVGNDRAVLLAVLTQLLPFIGYPRTLNGLPPSTRSHPPSKEG